MTCLQHTDIVPVATMASVTPIRITLIEDRSRREVAVEEGEALLHALKRAGIRLAAICGGKGACGTCRVHIGTAWQGLMPEPHRREARLLEFTKSQDGDRLSCRIPLTAEMDGLEVHIPIESKGDV
jgi:ferredoxin